MLDVTSPLGSSVKLLLRCVNRLNSDHITHRLARDFADYNRDILVICAQTRTEPLRYLELAIDIPFDMIQSDTRRRSSSRAVSRWWAHVSTMISYSTFKTRSQRRPDSSFSISQLALCPSLNAALGSDGAPKVGYHHCRRRDLGPCCSCCYESGGP